MEYRILGDSDLKLSVICFGAWAAGGWMWGGSDRNDAIRAIRASYELGVTTIDTAPAYGQGASEEIVAEAIEGLPRDKVQILTKYGMRWDDKKGSFSFHSTDNNGKPIDMYRYASPESIIKECEDSLRRLKTDYIDLYQIHWPDITTPIAETMEAVAKLIQQGKVRYAGVCNYDVAQMKEAQKVVRAPVEPGALQHGQTGYRNGCSTVFNSGTDFHHRLQPNATRPVNGQDKTGPCLQRRRSSRFALLFRGRKYQENKYFPGQDLAIGV